MPERRFFSGEPGAIMAPDCFPTVAAPDGRGEENSMSELLFSPFRLGALELPSRIVMAPMTRCRTSQPGDIPNRLMGEYYAQRAGAGLIVSEATQISRQGQGYSWTPGLYTAAQVEGWQGVTDQVHRAGGRIFAQLWHVGRMSHSVFHAGALPVAPTALAPDAQGCGAGGGGQGHLLACPGPRELRPEGIHGIVLDYRRAALNALEAGFDGVEIHGANGYLIDQFLRTTSNRRQDDYGGSRENRARFLLEVTRAVAEAVGPSRTGVRLAPYITARNMNCPDIIPTILYAAGELDALKLAYLHLSEADWDDAPTVPEAFRQDLRQAFHGAIVVAGRYDRARAEAVLAAGYADLVAFGRPFIANPDLPRRLEENLPLAQPDPATLFGGGEQGYTSYPGYFPA